MQCSIKGDSKIITIIHGKEKELWKMKMKKSIPKIQVYLF